LGLSAATALSSFAKMPVPELRPTALESLVEALSSSPAQPVRSLNILPAAERERLLEEDRKREAKAKTNLKDRGIADAVANAGNAGEVLTFALGRSARWDEGKTTLEGHGVQAITGWVRLTDSLELELTLTGPDQVARIERLLRDTTLSQNEIARAVGVSRSTVAKYAGVMGTSFAGAVTDPPWDTTCE